MAGEGVRRGEEEEREEEGGQEEQRRQREGRERQRLEGVPLLERKRLRKLVLVPVFYCHACAGRSQQSSCHST